MLRCMYRYEFEIILHHRQSPPQVNEVPLRGKNVNEVCDIMAKMQGTLTLLVVPTRQPPHVATSASTATSGGDLFNSSSLSSSSHLPPQQHQPVMHVKAHIDYDPEDDLYLPCRELGLSFLKVSKRSTHEMSVEVYLI